MESCGLIDVEDGVDVDDVLEAAEDWLCAAISALIVSGEICARLPELTGELSELDVLPLPSTGNGVPEPCVKPVCRVEDDFCEVSACNASSAEDTAPRANNIRQLQPVRPAAVNARNRSASGVPAQNPQ
jgi:hypothetical protein